MQLLKNPCCEVGKDVKLSRVRARFANAFFSEERDLVAKGTKLRVSDIVLSRRRSCHTQRNKKTEIRNFLELVHSSDPAAPTCHVPRCSPRSACNFHGGGS